MMEHPERFTTRKRNIHDAFAGVCLTPVCCFCENIKGGCESDCYAFLCLGHV